jgi:DNA-binding transcriptional LysR family regulator
MAGVRSGELDAAFFFGSLDAAEVSAEPLRALTYRVAFPAEWGLDARRADWSSLASRPWILAPETSSHRDLAMQLFTERGVAPTQITEADSETVILNLIRSGVGASIVREELALGPEQEGRIALWTGAKLETRLWFIHQASRAGDPLLEAMRAVLRELWRHEEAAQAA